MGPDWCHPVFDRCATRTCVERHQTRPVSQYVGGGSVEIGDDYRLASWRLLKKVVADLTAAASAKLSS
jgi:hypothetical protein